jgi:hypothetical protein
MTEITRTRSHSTAANRTGRRSPRGELRRDRRPSIQLVADGVVAAYLHEISQRHGHPADVSNWHHAKRVAEQRC